MQRKRITWMPDCYLNEIYQSTQTKFAFVSGPKGGWCQCHPFVECRDFLHDAVRAYLNKSVSSIYSFRYGYNESPPIDLSRMRMLVTRKGIKEQKIVNALNSKMNWALKILHSFEKDAGISLSRLSKIEDENCKTSNVVWLFTGSSIWLKSPFFVSMYTLLIRLGNHIKDFNNDEELYSKMQKFATDSDDRDSMYLKDCLGKMDKILKNRWQYLEKINGFDSTYFLNYSISNFHDNCGIVSLCKGTTPNNELNKRVKEIK